MTNSFAEGLPADPNRALPAPSALRLARLLEEQRRRWQTGDRVRVETLLEREADLRSDTEAVLDLIYQEYLLCAEDGAPARLDDYLQRFPDLAPQLRAQFEVERALAGGESAAASTTPESLDARAVAVERPNIPGYEVLGELGQGGMGVVWKARHISLNRLIALKVLQTGSNRDLARFRQEAEAIARLQHPNIVQIHEIGEYSGQPYLALEYVAGGNLAQQLHGKPQPARTAAQLMETIARAMHYAHQCNVIHRDLKPANVLLAAGNLAESESAWPQTAFIPKIADFGLAKRLDVPAGQTQSGSILGTPSYMAPEQAAGRSRQVGAATDVYALGAILYELLTGRPPFRGETALDTVMQVLHSEPVPPGQLQPKVPRDLETICLECLHKEPRRRYPSAAALADDLACFLRDEPIRARPEGNAERLCRWARRNPWVAALLLALFLVLSSGLSVVSYLWALSAARGAALAQQAREVQHQRDRAENNLDQALEAGDHFFNDVSQEELLDKPGLQPLRKKLLANALDYYKGLVQQLGDEPRVQARLAKAHFRIGIIVNEIGSKEEALAAFARARDCYRDLLAEQPESSTLRYELAMTLGNIANLEQETGRTAEALSLQEEVRDLFRKLLGARPDDPTLQSDLARVLSNVGNFKSRLGQLSAATRSHREAFALRAKLVSGVWQRKSDAWNDLAASHEHLGRLFQTTGQPMEARQCYEKALGIRRKLLGARPDSLTLMHSSAVSLLDLGHVQHEAGKDAEARQNYEEGRKVLEDLAAKNPGMAVFRRDLAQVCQDLGKLEQGAGRRDEARRFCETAQVYQRQLHEADPDVAVYRCDLARTLNDLGGLQRDSQPAEALRRHEEARDLIAPLIRLDGENVDYRSAMGDTLGVLAAVLTRLDRHEEAAAVLTEAAAHQSAALEKIPQAVGWRRTLSGHYRALAQAQRTLGRLNDAAVADWEGARLVATPPAELYDVARALALCLPRVGGGKSDLTADEQAERLRYADQAMAALRQAIGADYTDWQQLETDPALAPLRARPDFAALHK